MFEPTSRYAALATATHTAADGRTIRYVRRRFLPHGMPMPTLAEVVVLQADRIDLIAGRTLGDPEQYWRICDANDAMHPAELTDEPGRTIRIAVPTPGT
ncbi:MAG TPA: hypothetical protein PKA05_22520 [Roseiflexaceae bacterium]|nr:hypothetical protein [Roseiflexaceae bacterium]HMP43167.1 hypothetical protein [Roseiflexaceae bacterium]